VLFLIWAILAALSWHWRLLTGQEKRREQLAERYTPSAPESPRYQPPPSTAEGHRRYM
jgi:hypothetical protein